jgi:hypothetical protein
MFGFFQKVQRTGAFLRTGGLSLIEGFKRFFKFSNHGSRFHLDSPYPWVLSLRSRESPNISHEPCVLHVASSSHE